MKKQLLLAIMFTMAFAMLFRADSFGQLLMNENFDYVAGSQMITNGWAQTGAIATNPILVSNGGLTYPTYMSSGIGNAAALITTGQDINYTFTTVSSGTLYAGFLVNVASSQTPGDYFLHFSQPPGTSIFKGRVFIKKDPASNNFAFGISKSGTTAVLVAYTPYSYTLNTTYLVVLKYEFVAGTTTNDNVGIFINPVPGAAEPASPTLSYIDNLQTDATGLGLIGLRQGTLANAAVVQVDGIRIGQTWADATAMEVIVPTLSEWGLIFLGLALLAAGTFYITRMRG